MATRSFERLAVLGAGSFGTALAELCARRGQLVTLWSRSDDRARVINDTHRNPGSLQEFELSSQISATADLAAAVAQCDWIIIAVPAQSVRDLLLALGNLQAFQTSRRPLVFAAKGIELGTLKTPCEIAGEVLDDSYRSLTLALSGPSFAREIMEGHPTAVVLACLDEALAGEIGSLLFSNAFRAYQSADVNGVELGGALKNVIAIASGAATGLGYGHNTAATLITRGLGEITAVAVARGASALTLLGLSGVGDLVLTCTGDLSRNRRLGIAMGAGKSLKEALELVGTTPEGVPTATSAFEMAQKLGVSTPIIDAVHRVLTGEVALPAAFADLVQRTPGREHEFC